MRFGRWNFLSLRFSGRSGFAWCDHGAWPGWCRSRLGRLCFLVLPCAWNWLVLSYWFGLRLRFGDRLLLGFILLSHPICCKFSLINFFLFWQLSLFLLLKLPQFLSQLILLLFLYLSALLQFVCVGILLHNICTAIIAGLSFASAHFNMVVILHILYYLFTILTLLGFH